MPFRRRRLVRLFCHWESQLRVPPELPFPFPGTDADKVTGPPNFSLPVVISRACKRWMKVVSPTVDLATTYIVLVLGSMTGVLVIPISGTMSFVRTYPEETVVSPAPSSETFHNGFALAPVLLSASKANALSCQRQ